MALSFGSGVLVPYAFNLANARFLFVLGEDYRKFIFSRSPHRQVVLRTKTISPPGMVLYLVPPVNRSTRSPHFGQRASQQSTVGIEPRLRRFWRVGVCVGRGIEVIKA
jgi:hypothetical protein